MGNGRKPSNPQRMPKVNGRKPPAPPVRGGRSTCDRGIFAQPVYLAVFIMDLLDRKKAA